MMTQKDAQELFESTFELAKQLWNSRDFEPAKPMFAILIVSRFPGANDFIVNRKNICIQEYEYLVAESERDNLSRSEMPPSLTYEEYKAYERHKKFFKDLDNTPPMGHQLALFDSAQVKILKYSSDYQRRSETRTVALNQVDEELTAIISLYESLKQ
jgi:hypothetical protein